MVSSKDSQLCVVCWHHHLPISTAVKWIDKRGWVFHQNYVTLLSWWRHPSNQLACSYCLCWFLFIPWARQPNVLTVGGDRCTAPSQMSVCCHCSSTCLMMHELTQKHHPPKTERWAEWILIATSRKYIFVLNNYMVIIVSKRNTKARNHQSVFLHVIQPSSTGPQVTWNSKPRLYCPRNTMSEFEPELLFY